MSEIKPCPFCGSTNTRAHVYGGGEPDAFMQCHDCSADGPNGLNREGAIEAWNRRTQPAQVPLRQALTDPENQPNQYGVEFLMKGPKLAFKIGNQQFTLDYEPTEPGEFEFMRDMLIHAFSTFTPDVKPAQVPTLTDEMKEAGERALFDAPLHKDWQERCAHIFRAMCDAAPKAAPREISRLTDDELFDLWHGNPDIPGESVFPEFRDTARAIEAALIAKMQGDKT